MRMKSIKALIKIIVERFTALVVRVNIEEADV